MNKARRKELQIAICLMEKARDLIEDIKAEEEDAHENMPENMQYNSERSEEMQEAISQMDYAYSNVDAAITDLQDYGAGDVKTQDLINRVTM